MSVFVVQPLESVHVDEQHGEREAVAPTPRHLLLEAFLARPPVEEEGQRIGAGQRSQPLGFATQEPAERREGHRRGQRHVRVNGRLGRETRCERLARLGAPNGV